MLSSPDINCERRRLSDLEVGSGPRRISGKPPAEVASEEKKRVGRERKRDGAARRGRKLGLITSCIFKQAHVACGEESSILIGGAH